MAPKGPPPASIAALPPLPSWLLGGERGGAPWPAGHIGRAGVGQWLGVRVAGLSRGGGEEGDEWWGLTRE